MTKVIHIRSSGRSGSTLLNILLDRHGQIFAGAELFRYRWLWTRIDSIQSANGELVSESKFWNKVKKRVNLSESVSTLKPEVFVKSEVVDLFEAICTTSGKEIVCDTSKSPSYSSIIYDHNYFDTVVVHLIRDGRAVVHSRNLPLVGAMRVALLWTVTNFLSLMPFVRRRANVRVKYEDLVFDTESCVDKIRVEVEKHFDMILSRSKVSDTAQYAFAGNSMRASFDGAIFYDSRYIREMSFFRWWVCTLIMLPSLLIYRYPLRRSGLFKYMEEHRDLGR